MSSRLQRMLGSASLAESVGSRDGGYTMPSSIDVSGPDITAGRYGYRQCSMVAMDRIIPDPDQPRKEIDAEELQSLANSIRERGLMQPIRIRWQAERGLWVIVSGERRYRAHELIGAKEIAALCVENDMTESDVRIDQIIENALRTDLKPCEQARAFKELMDREGWSGAELARRLNLSRSSISESLSLLKLSNELQEEVDRGNLPVREAYQQAREKTKVKSETKKTPRARKKRKRGLEMIYRTSQGAKIVITFPRKVGDAEIRSALLEAANQGSDLVKAA